MQNPTPKKLLIECNYDVMKVLNNYHEVSLDKPTNHPKTTNQQIYSEIRTLMDTGAKKFRVDQENAKKTPGIYRETKKVGY